MHLLKKRFLKLRTIYSEKHNRFQEPEALIQEKNDTKEILTNFINSLRDLTGEQTEFSVIVIRAERVACCIL